MMLRPAPVTVTRIPTFAVSPPNNNLLLPLSPTLPNFRSLCITRSNKNSQRSQHLLPSAPRFPISSSTKNSYEISRSPSQWITSYTDITMDGDHHLILSGIILSPGVCCGFSAPRRIRQDGELAAVIYNVDRILDKFPEYHNIIIHSGSQNVIDLLKRVFLVHFEPSGYYEYEVSALKLKERLRNKKVMLKHLRRGKKNQMAHALGKIALSKLRTLIEYSEVDLRKMKWENDAIDNCIKTWNEICDEAIKDGKLFLL